MYRKLEIDFAGRKLSLETGRLAKQAHGAVLAQYGETVVLATVVSAYDARPNIDFLPLTVDYQEQTFAAGKIPGGFFKREGRPSEKEILTSRLIDRSMRPLFPKGYDKETQVVVTVLSADRDNDPDMLSLIAASAALEVSDIPHDGPVAAVRMGRVDGKLVVNPTAEQLEQSDISMVVAAKPDSIVMLEGGAQIVDEEPILEALFTAHEDAAIRSSSCRGTAPPGGQAQARVHAQGDSTRRCSRRCAQRMAPELEAALAIAGKKERSTAVYALLGQDRGRGTRRALSRARKELAEACEKVMRERVRRVIIEQDKRIDDRKSTDIRQLSAQVQVLPRTHGSALFTRGETQALATVTLGTSSGRAEDRRADGRALQEVHAPLQLPAVLAPARSSSCAAPDAAKSATARSPSARLLPVLPPEEDFPYTIRVVSEVLESNGSSSMATVCGGSLALMDAGVPIKAAVAGIAMGLVKEGEQVRVLTDILGDEDHLGDMDFKVAGTADGITAIQMDNKVGGVTREVMRQALHQARDARLFVLSVMEKALQTPRTEVSTVRAAHRHHPDQARQDSRRHRPRRQGDPRLVEETGCKIDIEDDGTVLIASADGAAMDKAIASIQAITAEPEVGRIYKGTVRKMVEFGAFVEIMPGTDGLLHISQLSNERVRSVEDVAARRRRDQWSRCSTSIASGKIRLSLREAQEELAKKRTSAR